MSRRIEISVTLLPFLRNVRLNNFHSNKQLEDAVLASACVTRLPMHMPGLGWVMGGCFSNSQIREVRNCFMSVNSVAHCDAFSVSKISKTRTF